MYDGSIGGIVFQRMQVLFIVVFLLSSVATTFCTPERNVVVPVCFVVFGEIPLYLRMNIELVNRKNPVVVIWDRVATKNVTEGSNSEYPINFESMKDYFESAHQFEGVYTHICHDRSIKRRMYELQCIQRWLVINEYAKVNNILVLYFSDGDSFLFANARDAFLQRSHCGAVLNVEAQHGDLHWLAAGESSLWTKTALQEFVTFVFQMYTMHKKILLRKLLNRTCVVDMSILWLWWVAHFEFPSFRAGRPWSISPELLLQHRSIADHRAKFDHAFLAAKSLNLPSVNLSSELCNGMDVVASLSSSMPKRTVFDHMHGWIQGINFILGAGQNESGIPSIMGTSLWNGGTPETLNATFVQALQSERLYFNNLHYQGGSKSRIVTDICAILNYHGLKNVKDEIVKMHCTNVISKKS